MITQNTHNIRLLETKSKSKIVTKRTTIIYKGKKILIAT